MYLTNPLIFNTFLKQRYNFVLMAHDKLFFQDVSLYCVVPGPRKATE